MGPYDGRIKAVLSIVTVRLFWVLNRIALGVPHS